MSKDGMAAQGPLDPGVMRKGQTMHDLFDGSDTALLPSDPWSRTPRRSQAYLCGLDAAVTLAVEGNERWRVRLLHSGDMHYSPTDYATREEGEAVAVAMVSDMARDFMAHNCAIEGPEQAQLANGPSRMESSTS